MLRRRHPTLAPTRRLLAAGFDHSGAMITSTPPPRAWAPLHQLLVSLDIYVLACSALASGISATRARTKSR